MTLTKRYTLIAIGIIIFLIAAPAFVFGVRGYIYDFSGRKLVATGILVAKTEPKGAQVTISGPKSKTKKTPATFRFLPAGDYTVKIEKPGFYPWQKKLTIKGTLVTWLSNNSENLNLMPVEARMVRVENDYQLTQPKLNNDYVYRFEKSSSVPNMFDLIRVNNNNPADKLILNATISANDGTVFVTPSNLVFALINRTLYQITSQLEYIADGVEIVSWSNQLNKLVYGNAHEISFYNPFDPSSAQRELITRTSERGGRFCVISETGYLLRGYGDSIRAIELDGRDRRNIYQILKADSPVEILECSDDGKKIVIKENQTYKIYSLKN